MTDAQMHEAGQKIAEFLKLAKNSNGTYNTSWGTKTEQGLAASILRIINEVKES